jgi:outer membrane biogenesis lipoprotein LolB
MKQFVKIGALALLLACSAHTGKGSVIKNAQRSNVLAQAQESKPI